jgi:hypothetical protein
MFHPDEARGLTTRMITDDLALLDETRSRLLRDLRRIRPGAVEWAPLPGARTIAESLLHIAAVEFIFTTALALRSGTEVPVDLWDQLKGGLATEVGYDPPTRIALTECVERLERVRNLTRTAIEHDGTPLTESDLRLALETLRDFGADLPSERLEALLPKLAAHLGVGPIGVTLTAHEEYHRGQVLYQNYLAARLPSAA